MIRRPLCFLAVAVLALAGRAEAPAKEPPETIVRVAIVEDAALFHFGSSSRFEVFDLASGKKKTYLPASDLLVKPEAEGISIGKQPWGNLVRIMAEDGIVRIDGRKYRNTLLVRRSRNDTVFAINELDIDEYVYGILPREVSPSWPLESLKAQAVVSRTFALRHADRHSADGFGLCSKVHCQVYGGLASEHERTNEAVDRTHNQVLAYEDDLANTVFFANCGGRTENPSYAWDNTAPPAYLKSVRCRHCSGSKHFAWSQRCSQEQILRALGRKGVDADGRIGSISLAGKGPSGRAKWIKIKVGKRTVTLRTAHFRMAMGPEVIRSTNIKEVRRTAGGSYLFKGRGWGHGVGLCQDGARGMAQGGTSYRKILKHYYPGTALRTFED